MDCLSKGFIILLAFLVVGCNFQVKENYSEDEKELRKEIQSYVDDFNNKNADKLGEYYAEDAVYYYPDSGDAIIGREAIVQMFKKTFEGENAPQVKITVDKVQMHGDNAIQSGTATLTYPDKSQLQNVYVTEVVKDNGKWRAISVSEVTLEAVPEQSKYLQDLAWLIGTWNDTSDEFDIVNDVKWDKYKHFLKQHFTVQVLGKDQLEGIQIIGWDPQKETVRSWLFDSDGGIGEGTWKKVNDSWYVDMTYILSDGSRASAVHIYKKEDDNKYTFTSTNRDIDGNVLPDVGPVTFVKATK